LITSLASTGTATGSLTMTAAITRLLPCPASAPPGGEPPRNEPAARAFFPRRRNSASSIANGDRLPGQDQQHHNMGRRLPGLPRGAKLGEVGFRAVCPAYIDGTRDNHTLLVTFARLHGANWSRTD
jgi:hypothetical protein